MKLTDSASPTGTRVLAIKRHPVTLESLGVLDLGPNVLTQKGRHVLMAKMAGTGPAQLPAGNTYLATNNWNLGFMSLGSNNTPGAPADTADLKLDTELVGSLKTLTAPAAGDVDETTNTILAFTGLGDTGLSYFTHVAWRCLYLAGEGNGDIREVGLWVQAGTSNPAGDFTPSSPVGLAVRGPLMSRKVLSGTVTKNASFALEFVWVYIG